MLNRIIRFSIENKLIIGLFTLGLIIWGIYSLSRLPIDAVPDITNNQVQVITSSPSLAAQEVEQFITYPVEISMATIPDVKEIRSISRFGLSVVTIVFEDGRNIYWARQQVQERLGAAKEQIPEGAGTPAMAPVTTGLGEIYQYIVRPEKGYEDRYTPMQLRTIEDWIVRRQLLGTPGVADVSSFGGFLKQYEIAIDPQRLRAADITIADLFAALKENNQNTGGAYIEKGPNAYFIRTEGRIDSLPDIGKIVLKVNPSGVPVLIRDVADVRLGHAVRYGAMTRNGNGEVVGGIVLMLKGGNSNRVIGNVKEKVARIEKTLPEGVTIEPFLDRSALVGRAIHTVSRNLTEGALIVIFVLVLFLGNLRSGLLVASVIPLAMLFALGMMNIFGVSGNLMSLGALDFGLIVDGAVIIVEAVMHRILQSKGRHAGVARLDTAQMNEQVYASAGKMMSSAAFGQIIILIVYLPILALTGIEGKMFRPMAETVAFAILGALLLSVTYVPMMATIVLPRRTAHKRNLSDRLMGRLQKTYDPVIRWALRRRWLVLGIAAGAFGISAFIFSRMGGEFIPQLDEGDFAVEMRLLPGSALTETINASDKAARILLTQFPEVKEVVGKIGSSEIPTDPMPVEACDLIVLLKSRDEWVTAGSREKLADTMSRALSVLPGVSFSFQQPIQMRFNELMTGAKQDVVLKIYGDQLDRLADLAEEAGDIVRTVDGATDVYVEQITGLPQIVVHFDRARIAQYGLNIADLNNTVQTAFAGQSAGLVFEGERRFDLVVRLDSAYRKSPADFDNLFALLPGGGQVPLNQVAVISIKDGPNQIQRDETRRRITVGFNVRNRDVQSIVNEIRRKMDAQLKWPPGYTVTYGGQFENLVNAQKRLSVALPAALLLIFILLFFAFGSFKQGLLIFTAVPLAAIGGVISLWVRGMSFSISAGVGFIALFGVAVLNGIVLVSEFNQLKKVGVTDIYERVLSGTRLRLRPVLMTATVASLGFLPMAVSTTAGAEVQRPLATVVIGGLITSTLLTLVVLPVLYILFEKMGFKAKFKKAPVLFIGLTAGFSLFVPGKLSAQSVIGQDTVLHLTLEQSLDLAQRQNLAVKNADLDIQYNAALKKTAFDPGKTELTGSWGKLNEPVVDDNEIGLSQRFAFPTVYVRRSRLGIAQLTGSRLGRTLIQNELARDVKTGWYRLAWLLQRHRLLLRQDSIYADFLHAAALRYKTGETNRLEQANASSQVMQLQMLIRQNEADIRAARSNLQSLLNTDQQVSIVSDTLLPRPLTLQQTDSTALSRNPQLKYLQQQIKVQEAEKKVQQSLLMPDVTLGVSSQTFKGMTDQRYSVFSAGLSIPLWPRPQAQRVKAAKIAVDRAQTSGQLYLKRLEGTFAGAFEAYKKYRQSIRYYRENALPQAQLILINAQAGYKSGEIGYVEYIQNLKQAMGAQHDYIDIVQQYNLAVIQLEYLAGIQ
ncbi:CusA/CzcA family heavy metal efflux RND transporter [Compostibacter hankyongensis]|uniref:CusA/CzcA family heavy metal efflux RND transporter n=1 Tax=Compostibacter hankyongensis TaxID=1007089 RepID=A0ABP8FR56_9BACT